MFSEQYSRMQRLENQVDVVITDSPLLLSLYYGVGQPESFRELIIDYSNNLGQDHFHIFLERKKRYSNNGRMQTFDEAIEIDKSVKHILREYNVKFNEFPATEGGYQLIYENIMSKINHRTNSSSDLFTMGMMGHPNLIINNWIIIIFEYIN